MRVHYGNLHFHSMHSDGVYTPGELVQIGKNEGYKALVLTDHDVASGVPELMSECAKYGIETMMGTEFTCEGWGQCFHMLGFDFDPTHKEMAVMLRYLSEKATYIAHEQFDYCIAKGYFRDITWKEVEEYNPGVTWFCNEPVFRTLKAKGMVDDLGYWEFFKHFREYSPKYNPYRMPTAETMVKLIREAGGVPVLAHPHNQAKYVEGLVEFGLLGVECSHELVQPEEEKELRALAQKHNLYMTGGTDHHGDMGGEETRFPDHNNRYHLEPLTYGVTEEEFRCLKERQKG
ncbi:MAG: PHP domain-containing protein [Eubacteriales bacterium]|nr:PHP domain-containing protein [Eubacteriales bacterium]